MTDQLSPVPPAPSENKIDLLELVGILWKHKFMIAGITFAAAVAIVIVSIISLKLPSEKSFMPNVFKPYSLVQINESSSNGGSLSSLLNSSSLGSLASMAGITASGSSDSALAIQLAETRTMLDTLAREFNLAEVYQLTPETTDTPRKELRKLLSEKISIKQNEITGILTISYEDIDKHLATRIVNRMTGLLEKRFNEIAGQKNRSQKKLLESKLKEVEEEMNSLQSQVLSFQEKYKVLDMESMALEQGEALAELRTKLITKNIEIETYSRLSGIEDPALRRLKIEREILKDQIRQIEEGENADLLMPARADIPKIAIEFERLKQEADIQVAIYKNLRQQYEVTKLTSEGTGPTFQVLEEAEIPEDKSGPSRGKLCMMVTIAAFMMSIFAAFMLEIAKVIISDPERMAKLRGKHL